MTSDEALKRITQSEDENVKAACDALRRYNGTISDCLMEVVASLCNMTVDELKNDSKHSSKTARSLYWYAYRQLTGEHYPRMAEQSGLKVSVCTVNFAVNKMEMIISQNNFWTKRWQILKRIVNEVLNYNMGADVTVTVNAPKNVNIEFKRE